MEEKRNTQIENRFVLFELEGAVPVRDCPSSKVWKNESDGPLKALGMLTAVYLYWNHV